MRRWIPRTLYAMLLGVTLPATLSAQQPVPTTPPVPMPAAGVPAPAPAVAGTPYPVQAPVVAGKPYLAATPYHATIVGQAVPSPQYNRPNYTLPCDNPNQNFGSYEPSRPDCFNRLFGRGGCNSCGGGLHSSGFGWLKGGGCGGGGCGNGGCGNGSGACATCGTAWNMAFGSSRSFFGESSRDFFERPVAIDGIRHHQKQQQSATQQVGGYIGQ